MKTVGIIGGSGFIGSYITQKFLTETYFTSGLTEQNYKVRVSATDITKSEKYLHLICLPNSKNLRIIPLDVLNMADLKTFIAGCDILIHCGTPFVLDSRNPERDLFEPTVKGTQNVLRVISSTPGLTKVIFVASATTHHVKHASNAAEVPKPFQYPPLRDYNQAKQLADELVRNYIDNHSENIPEIVTVSPVFVTGKAISERTDATSTTLQSLAKNENTDNPLVRMLFELDSEIAIVDVSDVADSIYKAVITPGLHGKHYLLSRESWHISDLSRMLNGLSPLGQARVSSASSQATSELGVYFQPFPVPGSTLV